MKVRCIKVAGDHLTVGKIYELVGNKIMVDDTGGECRAIHSRFEEVIAKQTPYEYLIEYYGLEEGKKYVSAELSDGREGPYRIANSNLYDCGDYSFNEFGSGDVLELMTGKATFTEIPQKHERTINVTDEQYEQIVRVYGL